jgi:hypothetical protein
MVVSKVKGGSFERKICKELSFWVSHGAHADLFWRSAMSGGRATVHGRDVRQCGDICSVSPEGHTLTDIFFIECKHTKNMQLIRFFTEAKGGPKSLMRFWIVCCREAAKHGKWPMLIAKQNGVATLMVLQESWAMATRVPVKGMPDCYVHLFDTVMARRFSKELTGTH